MIGNISSGENEEVCGGFGLVGVVELLEMKR